MNLFEILTNPIVIIALIGFLSKAYKMQNVERDEKKRPNPKLDPMHPKHFESKRSISKELSQKQDQIKPVSNIERQSKVYHPPEPIQQTYETKVVVQETPNQNIQPSPISSNTIRVKKRMNKTLPIGKSRIVEGVIWSEILGSPRAHKNWKKIK